MSKIINISSNGIKQAIDDLVDENERLQDKVYKLEDIIKEVRDYILSNQNTELSVDSYFKYEDLVEFNDILKILDKGSDKE